LFSQTSPSFKSQSQKRYLDLYIKEVKEKNGNVDPLFLLAQARFERYATAPFLHYIIVTFGQVQAEQATIEGFIQTFSRQVSELIQVASVERRSRRF